MVVSVDLCELSVEFSKNDDVGWGGVRGKGGGFLAAVRDEERRPVESPSRDSASAWEARRSLHFACSD